jgi:DNA polymerase-3 subunit alpha
MSQFDNSVGRNCRTVKMDFLGLKTLTYKDTVKLVKYRNGIDLDPDAFPIDDLKTYELFNVEKRWDNMNLLECRNT